MNFDDVALQVKRLDTGEGTYLRRLMEDMEVMGYVPHRISVESHRTKVPKIKGTTSWQDYLWKTDLNEMFSQFLETAP